MAITTTPTKRAAEKIPRRNILERISVRITTSLENFFYFWGFQIAKRPCMFIGGCIAFTLLSSLGLLGLNIENRPDRLWIPANSEFIKDSDWLKANFPSPIRIQYGLVTADDVLQPSVIKTLLEVHQRLEAVTNSNKKSWNDLCFKLPVTKFNGAEHYKRRRRAISSSLQYNHSNSVHRNRDGAMDHDIDNFEDAFSDNFFKEDVDIVKEFDPSIDLPESIYCDIVNSMPEACWEVNLAELWNYNSSVIENLTRDEILKVVNTQGFISPVFGRPVNISTELGGIERNETGHIVKAKAVLLRWYNKINQTQLALGEDVTFDMGTGETTTQDNLLWEAEFIKSFLGYTAPDGLNFYFKSQRSFGDISQTAIMQDGMILAVGIGMGFIYVLFMLGQFNCVEQRPLLAMAGLSCIGLSVIVCYGLGSALTLEYGPVHNILPFLLLGIGIDDMFVIMQCWNNLSGKEKKMPLPERVGLTMKHAGVSITVTSITDFVAFAVGGTTVLPALQSFCIYAAIGVIATYIFQATFFTSFMALDMRRSENNRNAFCCCITHASEYKPNECGKQNLAQRILEKVYAPILLSTPSKVLVLTATFAVFGMNIYGNLQLRQEFNPLWFLPYDSYMYKMLMARKEHFPQMGYDGLMVINNLTIENNMRQLDELETRIKATNQFSDFGFWYSDFKEYTNKHFDAGLPHKNLTKRKLNKYMSKFLYSPIGSKYRPRFIFNGNITCGKPSPPIQLTLTNLQFRIFSGPEDHIPAMHQVKDVVRQIDFLPNNSVRAFLWSMAFATWETEEIITVELYRNMALAMGCVLITTLLLITNLSTCIMVLLCVVLTIVDVLGGMYFWGLTIDTVSMIDMVLAIGLCVDYAAHIGHTFMTCIGTRDERAKQTLRDIGPAVLNGGFTTFLAFSLLTNSKSHVFITFFKVFFMVVMLGLYHGLVFLPVLLSIIGPQPYPSAYERHRVILTDIESEIPLQRNGSLTNGEACRSNDKEHDPLCNGNANVPGTELKLIQNSNARR